LIEIGSKTAEKTLHKQTDRLTDTTKIIVTWPWTKKLQDTGTVDRRPGSGTPRSARTEENVETVNDLVLSQEDKPQTHVQDCPSDITGDGYSSVSLFALSSISAEYQQKFKFSVSQGSVTTYLRW